MLCLLLAGLGSPFQSVSAEMGGKQAHREPLAGKVGTVAPSQCFHQPSTMGILGGCPGFAEQKGCWSMQCSCCSWSQDGASGSPASPTWSCITDPGLDHPAQCWFSPGWAQPWHRLGLWQCPTMGHCLPIITHVSSPGFSGLSQELNEPPLLEHRAGPFRGGQGWAEPPAATPAGTG